MLEYPRVNERALEAWEMVHRQQEADCNGCVLQGAILLCHRQLYVRSRLDLTPKDENRRLFLNSAIQE